VKVVLSGDGGDELFAGYEKYLVEQRERRWFVPAPARRALGLLGKALPDGMRGRNLLRHLSLTGPERYLDALTLFRQEGKQRLFQPEAFEQLSNADAVDYARSLAHSNGDWLSALQYLDLKRYLPLDILTKVDRMSMAHSLETRVPLLDHKLVEFAATIPPELRLRGGTTKYIFKRAMRGILPDEIIDRPKRGFTVPLGRWFRSQLGNFVQEILLSETCRQRGIMNTAYIEQMVTRRHHRGDLDIHLWTIISFELWCRIFLDGRSTIQPASGPRNGSPPVKRAGLQMVERGLGPLIRQGAQS